MSTLGCFTKCSVKCRNRIYGPLLKEDCQKIGQGYSLRIEIWHQDLQCKCSLKGARCKNFDMTSITVFSVVYKEPI